MELLLGCGNSREKKIKWKDTPDPDNWCELVTLDVDESIDCDYHHDLNNLPYPFGDSIFDEIHAYEVLEHCGQQGDWRFFFNQFYELWRILKPDGYLMASVPMWDGPWAWSDPGHTRIITKESLIFLDQREYENQVGKTAMTDYRGWWKGDFQVQALSEEEDTFGFVLQAKKP